MLFGVLARAKVTSDGIIDDAACTAGVSLESGTDGLPGLPQREAFARPAARVCVLEQLVLVTYILNCRLMINSLQLDIGNQLGVTLDEVIEPYQVCGSSK